MTTVERLAPGDFVQVDLANNVVRMRDVGTGQIITLDLGPADVHFERPLATYAAGYALDRENLIADQVSPVVLTPSASDYFYKWSKDDVFKRVKSAVAVPGGNVTEVSPQQSTVPFRTVQRAVRTSLPSEVQANADPAVVLGRRVLDMPLDKLLLERELLVAEKVTDPANYTAPYKRTLAIDERWNGGSKSNPVENLLERVEASLVPITGIAMSLRTYNAFSTNAQVQKFVASKTALKPRFGAIDANDFAAFLNLPPFIIGAQKYMGPSGVMDWVWGNNVVLFTKPKSMPPMGTPISFNTFRYTGGIASGVNAQQAANFGSVSIENGWGVRTYYDPNRGPQGSKVCVAFVQDDEFFVEEAVSGLIEGAWQTPP